MMNIRQTLQSPLSLLVLTLGFGCSPTPTATEPETTASATETSAPAPSESAPPTATPTTSAAVSSAPPAKPRTARSPEKITPEAQAVLDAKDRAEDDKKLDDGRHPAEMLSFFGLAKGQKVAELGAGGGYTSELFARMVGASGKVYAQNNKFIIEKFAEKPWSARLKKPVMKNVVRVDREFDEPLPPDAKNLDGVYMVLFYHDTYWMNVDRKKMNAAVFAALKPGGLYGIVDHSGREGTADKEVKTLHRIEESIVRKDIEDAGFVLVRESSFLRNPDDTMDWSASPSTAGEKRGTSDRFALIFKKP